MRSWFTSCGINSDSANIIQPQSIENAEQPCEPNQTADYTSMGVIHFIESEFTKNRMNELSWNLEKAELNAKIAFLNNLCEKEKNIIRDLTSRIKMLENVIRKTNDENPGIFKVEEKTEEKDDYDDSKWRSGEEMLKNYLEEIGLDGDLIDLRDSHVRLELGLEHYKSTKSEKQDEKRRENEQIEQKPIPEILTPIREEVHEYPMYDQISVDDLISPEAGKNVKIEIFPPKSETTDSKQLNMSCTAKYFGHVLPVRAVSFHPKLPLMATASDDHRVNLWLLNTSDTKTDQKTKPASITLHGSKSAVISVIFSEDGDYIVAGTLDGQVLSWTVPYLLSPTNGDNQAVMGSLVAQHSEAVWSLVSLCGCVVSLSCDGDVNFAEKRRERHFLDCAVTMCKCGGNKLVFGFSSGVVQVRDFWSFLVLSETNFDCGVWRVVSNSSVLAVLLEDGNVQLVKEGSLVGRLEAGNVVSVDLEFCLCVTGGGRSVGVWSGEECVLGDCPDGWFCGEGVTCVGFRGYGRVFAVGMADGAVLLYS